MSTIFLLMLSNIFMTFAWYGHLKYGHDWPLWKAVIISWGIALFEYCLAVPANRIGFVQFGSPLEVLSIFAKLGVTCFGGPIAHIGYFRHEFVVRRQWLDNAAYANLVGLCQFLPGPASSQVGFSLGLMRAGYLGGLAAWVGFTLPSADPTRIVRLSGARATGPGRPWSVARSQARRRRNRRQRRLEYGPHCVVSRSAAGFIAAVAALIVLMTASSAAQIAAIALGGIAGRLAVSSGSKGFRHRPWNSRFAFSRFCGACDVFCASLWPANSTQLHGL
jgi:chromate transport protein ChrA